MKLLVDENLAPRLAGELADLFPGSILVSSAELGSTSDVIILGVCEAHHFTLLTKDKDFASFSITWGAPPKVIVLQMVNCSNVKIERIIRRNATRFLAFENDIRQSLLILR